MDKPPSEIGQAGRSAALWVAGAMLAGAWAASVDRDPRWVVFSCLLGSSLLVLGWIDWNTFRLPDALTLPLIVLGLLAAWLDSLDALTAGAIGAVAGYAALVGVNLCYRHLRGRDGLGRGDAKLLAAGGAWLGWSALPWVVLLAAMLGLMLALLRRMRGERVTAGTAVPFGPALALAIWLIWIYGLPID
jgi:leader peptidase (prepilin peptidase) / N-methyltransferase